jgi:DNA-binding MarR family transcriptional regulator
MSHPARRCAREILETVPLVMGFIRRRVRHSRRTGLSLPQFRTLAFLDRAKNSSLSAVAEHLDLSLPAMSRLVNGLVDDRLVGRQLVSTNRRQIALTLTPPGRVALEKLRDEIRLELAASLRRLPTIEQKVVRRAMKVLHKIFGNHAAADSASHKVRSRQPQKHGAG